MAYPTPKSQYDFSLFEMKTGTTANISTAPKKRAEEKKPQMRVVVNNKRKNKLNKIVPASVKRNSVLKAGAVLFCLLAVLGMVIYMQAKLDNVNREIARTEKTLEETKSETVRLQMELNSIISIDKVEDYAVNTLGMVKIESGQVEYIDLSGENRVVLSGNKTLNLPAEEKAELEEENSSSQKLKIGEYGN